MRSGCNRSSRSRSFRGTWHWGPFPVGPEAVRMFNVQGKRYAEDNASVDLAARAGAVFEVLT